MRSRRALLGLLAAGATVLAAGGADALSWSRPTCDAFRQSVLDHDAFIRARVVRAWDHQGGEEERSAEVETKVDETITGRLPRGMKLVFTARVAEISGVPFGFIPAEGDEAVLFVDREAGRRWVVKSAIPAEDYDQYWVPRCGF